MVLCLHPSKSPWKIADSITAVNEAHQHVTPRQKWRSPNPRARREFGVFFAKTNAFSHDLYHPNSPRSSTQPARRCQTTVPGPRARPRPAETSAKTTRARLAGGPGASVAGRASPGSAALARAGARPASARPHTAPRGVGASQPGLWFMPGAELT